MSSERRCGWVLAAESRLRRCRMSGTLDATFRRGRLIPCFGDFARILICLSACDDFGVAGGRQAEYRPHHAGLNPRRSHGLSRREDENLRRTSMDWLRQSMVFEQAYSQAPLTVVSHATILSGTYPQTNRASEFGAGWRPLCRLFRICSARVDTARLPLSGPSRWIRKTDSLPASIADFQLTTPDFSRRAGIEPSALRFARPAAQVVARAAAWLARNPQGPFFLWVHLNDPGAASASFLQCRGGCRRCSGRESWWRRFAPASCMTMR